MSYLREPIGRFEPIGEEIGPKRSAFDVFTKEPYEFRGKQGFKGTGLMGFTDGNPIVDCYSVISEHWRWIPYGEQDEQH